jgi:hypothetical protein
MYCSRRYIYICTVAGGIYICTVAGGIYIYTVAVGIYICTVAGGIYIYIRCELLRDVGDKSVGLQKFED